MSKSITIFTTKTCAYCVQVKSWMKNKGIEYSAYDVTDDVEMRKELYHKTGYDKVPIIKVDEQYIVGPNWGKLAEAVA